MTRFLTIAVALVTVSFGYDTVPNPSKKKGAGPLFRIHRGELWGFMDRTGTVVIEPRFTGAGDFFEGLASVSVGSEGDRKSCFIDERGAIVIPCLYDSTGDFSDGLAPFHLRNVWGYLDRTGKVVIAPKFPGVGPFRDGLAAVMVWQEIPCVRQVSKARSIRTIVDEAMDRKTHCVTDEMHYGYINRKGEYAIQPQFREAKDFSEGVALVQRESPGGGTYTFIGKDGEVAVPGEFDVGHSFSEGLAAVETGVRFELNQKVAGKVGFIDKTGKYVILPRFEVASRFSEGLASVCEQWQVCGYIDRLGRFVNAPIYLDAWDFSDGLARVAVKQDDGYFYIDKTGKNVFQSDGSQWDFSDGLTIVDQGWMQVYVDHRGKVVAVYEFNPF